MIISDTHNDFFSNNIINYYDYLTYCGNIGIKHLFCSIFTSEIKNNLIFDKINKCKYILNLYNNNYFHLHIEDLSFLTSELKIKKLISIAPYSCSLTWNFDNQFCGGAFGTSGLTPIGTSLINKLLYNNILIDYAHLNEKSFYQVYNQTNSPIFVSHTGIKERVNSKRNISDEQIKLIIKSKGYIGLYFVEKYLKFKPINSNNIAKEIVFFIEKYGDKHIGIGTDYFGIDTLPFDLKAYEDFNNLSRCLKSYGYSNETIDNILYKNFDNFIKRIKKTV